ncbi:MAG: cysteine desulfurase [Verrucomicrobiales bacterium]|nr:cysteine desulfurase [Verrucomicrobiales bacterium]
MTPRSSSTVYFDYNATTPLDPEVEAAMRTANREAWANPSSVHRLGRHARALLDDARDRLAACLKSRPGEWVFTSGGTEANNLAVFGAARARRARGRHLVCSPVEHHAVLQAFEFLVRHEGFECTWLPVDGQGRVAPDDVARVVRADTALVSVMAANNETGVLQPVAEIGRVCRSKGVPFHTDALQWAGKEPLSAMAEFEADLVTLCGHKFHGPKGAGALWIRSPFPIVASQVGGGHELERRAGTENLPAILGFVEAVARFVPAPVFPKDRLEPLVARLGSVLSDLEGVQVLGREARRLANTVAFTVRGADSLSLIANLDMDGICASSGSACSSGSITPSHVLLAMGYSAESAASLVRFSLGRETTTEEVDAVCRGLPGWIARSRGGS